jgi:DNA-binding transcriptional regulator YhcF (GntR family)
MSNKKQKVIDRIRSEIVNGRVKPDQRLPSIREESQTFACSLNTIIRAYQELEREYLVYSRPKNGYYVVAQEALLPLLQTTTLILHQRRPIPPQ